MHPFRHPSSLTVSAGIYLDDHWPLRGGS